MKARGLSRERSSAPIAFKFLGPGLATRVARPRSECLYWPVRRSSPSRRSPWRRSLSGRSCSRRSALRRSSSRRSPLRESWSAITSPPWSQPHSNPKSASAPPATLPFPMRLACAFNALRKSQQVLRQAALPNGRSAALNSSKDQTTTSKLTVVAATNRNGLNRA